ncbi:hypothetical protein GUITHDRAFT_145584 [Guillardia theta CCMP2712]|uniref:RRM domain-containing protein n=1 Tax=Guillardia theta (strain CCMP2712) TaxID=905079 RepID=L1IKG8_GUITC|nr:hypothetical protein GUITHDRAFT_145584 [Guillardia theta CCMP2712]EKX36622.1 hypothetical protein GUITHDRAFT_145584 [Guillardia theta CCMP2712]|eukprot:XP_005823602.1 hypothetical protein GUITHDRAFT_145584 [Guillardia theta CCMP2712]
MLGGSGRRLVLLLLPLLPLPPHQGPSASPMRMTMRMTMTSSKALLSRPSSQSPLRCVRSRSEMLGSGTAALADSLLPLRICEVSSGMPSVVLNGSCSLDLTDLKALPLTDSFQQDPSKHLDLCANVVKFQRGSGESSKMDRQDTSIDVLNRFSLRFLAKPLRGYGRPDRSRPRARKTWKPQKSSQQSEPARRARPDRWGDFKEDRTEVKDEKTLRTEVNVALYGRRYLRKDFTFPEYSPSEVQEIDVNLDRTTVRVDGKFDRTVVLQNVVKANHSLIRDFFSKAGLIESIVERRNATAVIFQDDESAFKAGQMDMLPLAHGLKMSRVVPGNLQAEERRRLERGSRKPAVSSLDSKGSKSLQRMGRGEDGTKTTGVVKGREASTEGGASGSEVLPVDEDESVSTLVFSSDMASDEMRKRVNEHDKAKERERTGRMTEDERAKELLGYLHGHMHEKAKELKIRGISADAERMRRLFGEGKHQESVQFSRDSSPVAWRVDGDKRYPVYPGYEDFDPYIGPNGLQELINREGIDYTFDEGSTSADNSDVELMDLLRGINHSEAPKRRTLARGWPMSAINDTRPIGTRWVDTNTRFADNFKFQKNSKKY